MADGVDGFKVCRFLLVKVQEDDEGRLLLAHEPVEEGPVVDEFEAGPAPRIANTGSRTVRKSVIVDQVKGWYSNSCQVCGRTLRVAGGNSYSQGAHIKGLGRPHDGPDITSNVLCLCPNDHILFDNGALYLTDDLTVIDALEGTTLGRLRVDPRHHINVDHVRYHRSLWGA
jgi:predicted restriction endonuclease